MYNKKKKEPERIVLPPLPVIDHLIYIFMIVCFGTGAIIVFLNEEIRNNIFATGVKEILQDTNIVALRIRNGSISIWAALFVFLYIVTIILVIMLYVYKNPLVGDSNAKYGAPEYTEAYPLFSKKSDVTERAWKIVKKDRIQITAWVCCLVLCGVLTKYMPYEYQCLNANGSVDVYKSSGERIKHYAYREVKEVYIETTKSTTSKTTHIGIRFRIRMNRGGSRIFGLEDFELANGENWGAALEEMIRMSEYYLEDKPVYEDITYLSNVLRKYQRDDEQELIFQLFTTVDRSDYE